MTAPRPRVSEHTDAARLEALRDSMRPRVEGEQWETERRMMQMTAGRVAEWARLADAATPGPWFSDDATASPGDVSLWHGGNGPWMGEIVVNLGGSFVEVGVACENEVANARFIAAAREAVPALAAEVSRLTAEVARLRGALRPFAHPDLCESLGGNVQGDDSPIYGRNKAVLRLGDFRLAALALPTNAPEAKE